MIGVRGVYVKMISMIVEQAKTQNSRSVSESHEINISLFLKDISDNEGPKKKTRQG